MLTVTTSVTLGRLRYDSHAVRLRLRRGLLPIVDRLDLRLPRGLRVEAVPGDEAACDLDAGEGGTTVFTGKVTAVRRHLSAVDVTVHGGGHRLAQLRPSLSLEQVTVADVVRRLAGDAEVATGALLAGPTLARYVATARVTALAEVARLVTLAGGRAWVDHTDTLQVASEAVTEVALRHGRELVSVSASRTPATAGEFVVVGEGAGAPGSAQGLWPVADFWGGGAPVPGPGVRLRAAHEIRTTDDARAAGEAWARRDAERRAPVRLRCWLQPSLSPGDEVTITDAPPDLGLGKIRVRQVCHQVDPAAAAITDVWGYDAAAVGAGLAAPGGLP